MVSSILPKNEHYGCNQSLDVTKHPSFALENTTNTGKSLSEALIFAPTNPQCDDRLFIEL